MNNTQTMKPAARKVNVIGHKNPDTDSVCSAISYANLKNQVAQRLSPDEAPFYEPRRAGAINEETRFVLERFGFEPPRLCLDVHPKVRDIDIRQVEGVDGDMTLRSAWETMRDKDITALPITTPDNHLEGIITLQDVAVANMDSLDPHAVATAKTSYKNIIETIRGTLVTGSIDQTLDRGKIVIAAGSPEAMETMVEPGDIVLVANRYEAQLCAIELEAACLVVCLTPNIARTIIKIAEEHGCTLISTPYDTYTASCLINQSVPIRTHMHFHNLITFQPETPVEEAKKEMGKVRHHYFPIIRKDGSYIGVISRRNLLNLQRKRLILVDHNEKTQCVDGFEEADILEIIDHHRIGSLETTGPVYFRNQPVGCTATIVTQMYREEDITIEPNIAGLLLSAILSDTLIFRSPTCTEIDKRTARQLAEICGEEPEKLAVEMFEAGENLDNKTADQLVFQDFKIFANANLRFGVGQSSFVSAANREKATEMLRAVMTDVLRKEHLDMVFFMLTDILNQSSEILFAGVDAQELLESGFHSQPLTERGTMLLPGVVSRKKQFIPALISGISSLGG